MKFPAHGARAVSARADGALDIAAALRDFVVARYGTGRAAARAWNVSSSYVSRVLAGERQPTAAMLADAGIECIVLGRTVSFYKKDETA